MPPRDKRVKKKLDFDPMAELCAEMNSVYDFGGYITTWDENNLSTPRYRISTGSNLLDMALGGGLPTGRIVELYGWPGTGKSTLCSHAAASVQAQGGFYFILDAEASVDKDRDKRLGVLPDRYFYGMVETVEHGFDLIDEWIEKIASIPDRYKEFAKEADTKEEKQKLIDKGEKLAQAPKLIVWDTIAASPTEADLNQKEFDDDNKSKKGGGLAEKARLIRSRLRSLTNPLGEHNVCLVLVNHLSENLKGYAPDTVCGWAIKYWASLRLHLKKFGDITVRDRTVGIYSKAVVVKSKVSPPKYEVVIPINFMNGVDRAYEAFDYHIGAKSGIVQQNGAWYAINGFPKLDDKFSLYYADLPVHIEKEPKLLDYLLKTMRDTFFGKTS